MLPVFSAQKLPVFSAQKLKNYKFLKANHCFFFFFLGITEPIPDLFVLI